MVNDFKQKRVFITGHTGFKGAWLSHWLARMGADVAGYSIDVPTRPSLFEALNLKDRMHHNLGDVNDREMLGAHLRKFSPEFVFHLAAQPLVRFSYDNPILTFQTNVMGTAHLLENLRGLQSLRAAILVTTDKVYDATNARPFVETDTLGGHDPYSGSKAACELVVQSYFKSFFAKENEKVGIGVVRAGNVIGGGDFSVDRLIPDAVRAWRAGNPLVVRSPEAVRPWQHVLEPLSGYLSLAAKLAREPKILSGEAFNFGPPEECGGTVEEVTQALQLRWKGFEVQVDRSQTGLKKETQILRLNWQKANRLLNWSPRLPLADALDWTAAWYEAFYNSPPEIKSFTDLQIDRYSQSPSIQF